MRTTPPTQCPCGSKNTYIICCGKFHKGKLHAPTAEALMRSRYSAYVINDTQYLYRTWHEDKRPSLQSLREGGKEAFVLLEIISTSLGQNTDTTGTVEFVAHYKNESIDSSKSDHSQVSQYYEHSNFEKIKGKWVYVDAVSEIQP